MSPPERPEIDSPRLHARSMVGRVRCRDGRREAPLRWLLRLPPRDVVAHEGSVGAAVEAGGGLEQDAVAGGDALVLSEVLDPGLDDEHLELPARVRGVAVHVPADGAVAAADRLEPPHGAQELLGLVGVHVVLERDEHGAFVAVELVRGLR